MEFTKQLPDTTDFGELIDNNCIYVDKTAIINQFASKKGPFFISRPSRFVKSTLINTLHELFAHGTEKFKGLEIEPLWHDKTYKVLHLDFSSYNFLSEFNFNDYFYEDLKQEFLSIGLKVNDSTLDTKIPALLVDNVLKNNPSDQKIVLLIDEYDTPMSAVLNNEKEFIEEEISFMAFIQKLNCTRADSVSSLLQV